MDLAACQISSSSGLFVYKNFGGRRMIRELCVTCRESRPYRICSICGTVVAWQADKFVRTVPHCRLDDIVRCMNSTAASRLASLSYYTIDGSAEGLDDGLALDAVPNRIASLQIDQFVSCGTRRSDSCDPVDSAIGVIRERG